MRVEREIEPSTREQRVLQVMFEHFVEHSEWPTIRHIGWAIAEPNERHLNPQGEEVGISTSMVIRYFNNLEKMGFVKKGIEESKARILTPDGIRAVMSNNQEFDNSGELFNLVESITSAK